MNISEQAIKFVKSNKRAIIHKFASVKIYKSFVAPATFFMAGSPGAGKTETSREFIIGVERIINSSLGAVDKYKIVRIDGDEIRKMLPNYFGSNSNLFQGAISVGVNKLIDHCFNKNLNMLVDGTFASPNSFKNISNY